MGTEKYDSQMHTSKLTINKIQKFSKQKATGYERKEEKFRAANWAVFAITSETVMTYSAHGKIKW